MRRFLILFLCLVFLILVFAVPAFAITADDMATSLQSGWTSTYPTGYSSSWFYRVITLLKTIDSNVDSIEVDTDSLVTYSSNIYQYLSTVKNDVSTIKSTLSDIKIGVNGVKSSVDLVKTSVDNMKSSVDSMKTTVTSIGSDIGLIESDVDTIRSEVVSIDSTTTTISTNLSDVKSKVTDIELNTDYLETIDSDTSNLADLSTSLQNGSWLTSSSGGNWFKNLFNVMNNVYSNTKKLTDVFATTDDLELKASQAHEEKAILSGLAQVDRVGTINDFTGLEGDMKEFFAMDDVDIGLMFGQVESGYSNWFSGYTARCLAVGGGSSAVSGAVAATYGLDRAAYEEPETPYLDAYAAEVASILAGGHP